MVQNTYPTSTAEKSMLRARGCAERSPIPIRMIPIETAALYLNSTMERRYRVNTVNPETKTRTAGTRTDFGIEDFIDS